MKQERQREHVWWGKFAVPEDKGGYWRIGSANILVERSSHEWVLACESTEETNGDEVSITIPVERQGLIDTQWRVARFGMGRTDGNLSIVPALADRPVVIRTQVPFYLPPRQEIVLYVSAPLWFRIETCSPPITLTEFPIHRPSDTWFGPSPKEGEYCYANRVYGQLKLENIRFRPQRAISVIHLKNKSSDTILIERLKLPSPFLSLYEGESGWLWTQALTLEFNPDRHAEIQLKERAPSEAKSPRLVSGPRQKADKNILSRAFDYLIN
jgi:hypothetical protein